MSKKQQDDVLLGRRVQINDSAPFAGMRGTITKAFKGGQYEVTLPGDAEGETRTWNYAMGDFAVLHDEVAASVPSTLVEADPYLVAVSLSNPRRRKGLDVESIAALASSIKAQGLAQPILVRPLPGSRVADTFRDREEGRPPAEYELVCGERRLRASRLAGMEKIPMLVRALSDDQALELQLVENIEREDLDPLEEAEGFELLRTKLGYTVEQIAERIGKGKSKDYIYKTMKLLALTPASREAVYEGHLGRSTGLLVARYPAEQQADVVAFIKSQAVHGEPAPFRDVAPKVFTRFNLDLKKAVWAITDETLVPAAGACTACPKRSGANADLFGDDENSPDSCTDPDCFASKRAAHIDRAKAEAKKQGLEVIDGDAAKEAAMTPYASWLKGYSKLTDIAATVTGDDGQERQVTFEDALRSRGKKAPKPKVLIHPFSGEAIKVIPSELAEELEDEYREKADNPAAAAWDKTFGKNERDDDRPEDVQALDRYEVRRAVVMRIFDAVRNRGRTDAEVLVMAKALMASCDDSVPQILSTYLNWDADLEGVDYSDVPDVVNAKLDALPPAEVAAIATMAAIEIATYTIGEGQSMTLQLSQAYGVDVLAVRDKVNEDIERRERGADEDADDAQRMRANPSSRAAERIADEAEANGSVIDPNAAWPFPVKPGRRGSKAAKSEAEVE